MRDSFLHYKFNDSSRLHNFRISFYPRQWNHFPTNVKSFSRTPVRFSPKGIFVPQGLGITLLGYYPQSTDMDPVCTLVVHRPRAFCGIIYLAHRDYYYDYFHYYYYYYSTVNTSRWRNRWRSRGIVLQKYSVDKKKTNRKKEACDLLWLN